MSERTYVTVYRLFLLVLIELRQAYVKLLIPAENSPWRGVSETADCIWLGAGVKVKAWLAHVNVVR